MTDFTQKHTWTADLLDTIKAGRLADPPKTWEALSAETGIPRKTLYSKCGPATKRGQAWAKEALEAQNRALQASLVSATKPSQATDTQTDKEAEQESGGSSPSHLEAARTNARKLLSDAVSGMADPSAQQIAAARLLLKDELEPAGEGGSPYAGIPTDELALRALTLAVSTLGLVRVTAILREEAKRQTLDLGIDWEPREGDADGRETAPGQGPLESPPALAVAPDGQAVPAAAEGPTASPQGQGDENTGSGDGAQPAERTQG